MPKVLAIFDADDTLWECGGAVWDDRVKESVDPSTLKLESGRTLKLRKDARAVIEALRGSGVLTGIVSHNIDDESLGVKAALSALDMERFFDCIVVRDSSDKNGMIADICRELGVEIGPDSVFFIDDNVGHVSNAVDMGVSALQCTGSVSLNEFRDMVLRSLEDGD